MKNVIKNLPVIGPLAKKYYFAWSKKQFQGSQQYWIDRYRAGGSSGSGAYEMLAEYKAEIVNKFVQEHQVRSVIEFGSGDGNQLSYADYPKYLGVDVSAEAVQMCREKYASDQTKEFVLLADYDGVTADLAISLDVIYHLIEDEVFDGYMKRLVNAGERFVAVYSSNTYEQRAIQSPHVKHRKFSDWLELNAPEWQLKQYVPNRFPYKDDDRTGSFCDFYFFEKKAS